MQHDEGFIADGYVHEAVPSSKLGSAWEVFFIVAGMLCGLPAYALSAQIASAIGFESARSAFVVAGCIGGVLAAFTSYVGARTRMNLAMMSDHTFGTRGGVVVKTALALCLLGWFTVILGVLGTTLADAIYPTFQFQVPPPVIKLAAAVAIAVVTLRGVGGLESVGKIIAPTLVVLLAWTLYRGCGAEGAQATATLVPTMSLGAAISAVVGGNIVGILIQPDYSRFVRRPGRAAIASGVALGIAYPLVLTFTALPIALCGAPNLIAVMVSVGIGVFALALLSLGALIDGGASLYSGSLSLANELRRFKLPWVVAVAAAGGLVLALLHAEEHYILFLTTLGIALPPVGALIVLHVITAYRRDNGELATAKLVPIRLPAIGAWLAGAGMGYASEQTWLQITGIPALDAILVAGAIWGVVEFGATRSTRLMA